MLIRLESIRLMKKESTVTIEVCILLSYEYYGIKTFHMIIALPPLNVTLKTGILMVGEQQ